MYFDSKSPLTDILYNDLKFECVNEYKLLGIVFDSKLKFKTHLLNLSIRIIKFLPLFYNIRHYLTVAAKKLLYSALVQSILTYCSEIFMISNSSDILCVDKAQKKT